MRWRANTVAIVPVLAAFALAVAGPANTAVRPELTRYPYLTDTFGSNATINFASDRSAGAAEVRWGAQGSEPCDAHQASATRTGVTVASAPEYQWQADLNGLSSDTAYCYRVYLDPSGQAPVDLLGADPSPTFTTLPQPGSSEPFSFAVFGDWGMVDSNGANPDQAGVLQQVASSGAQFAVTTGDNSYPSGTQANYGDLLQTGAGLSTVFGPSFWAVPGRSIPIFPTIGNHGLSTSLPNHPQLVNFPQDRAVSLSGGRYVKETYCCVDGTNPQSFASAWYAFDVGNSRFYVLDAAWANNNVGTGSMFQDDHDAHWVPGTPEYDWLVNDLASHPSQLKFAFFHFPLYSDNKSETSDPFIQGPNELEGLLSRYGVDIAFNGHAHIYERNRPNGVHGLVSYVTGGGGATLEPIGPACSAVDAYGIGWSPTSLKGTHCGAAASPTSASQVFHFLLVHVSGSTVTVTPTDELGRPFDAQTYDFMSTVTPPDTTPPTDPTGVQETASTQTTASLAWSASTDNVGVAGYHVYRLDGGGSLTLLGSTASTSFTVTGLTCGQAYTFAVDAYDAAGNQSAAVAVSASSGSCAVFSDGFESGDLTAWTSNAGLVAQQQTVASGAWAARATTTGNAVYAYATLPVGYTDLYMRIRFNVLSQGANSVNLLKLRTSGGGFIGGLSLSNTDKLALRNDSAGITTTSVKTATRGNWHQLQIHLVAGGPNGQAAVWLDGAAVPDLSVTQSFGTSPIARVQIGDTATGRTFSVAFDDVVASTAFVSTAALRHPAHARSTRASKKASKKHRAKKHRAKTRRHAIRHPHARLPRRP